MNVKKIAQVIVLLCVFLACSAVVAFSSNERGGRGGMQGPPPEAIEACSGKAEGESVTFAGRRGESLTATCRTIDDQLVAVPEGHKQRQ